MMTLSDITKGYLIERGQQTLHNFPWYLDLAITGLKQLWWDVNGVPQVAILTVDHLNRASLPKDYISIYRIGFLGADKRLVEIFKDPRIVTNFDQKFDCNSDSYVSPNTQAVRTPDSIGRPNPGTHFRNGEAMGGYFGREGGSKYGYNLDLHNGVIEFSTNVTGDVIIEYISNPKKINGAYQVHPWLEEPIKAWIEWASKRRKDSVGRGEKEQLKRNFYTEKHNAKVKFATQSMGALINASRKTVNQAAKF